MYLSNSLPILLLLLGTIAAPQPGPVIYALHQNSQRQLPSVPLAPILSPPLRLRAGIAAAESDTSSGAIIQARQLVNGADTAGSTTELEDDEIAKEAQASAAAAAAAATAPAPPPRISITPDSHINNVYISPNGSHTNFVRPPAAECSTLANDSNSDTVDATVITANPFEVRNVSISSPPNATFSFFFTDFLGGYNSSTICYVNASCSVPFPGLHLQASMKDTSNSTSATAYATFTDLPSNDGFPIQCGRPNMYLLFGQYSDTINTTFFVILRHVVYTNATMIRETSFNIDLNKADAQTQTYESNDAFIARSNVTVGSGNNTWSWLQASDGWYNNVRSSVSSPNPGGDVYNPRCLSSNMDC